MMVMSEFGIEHYLKNISNKLDEHAGIHLSVLTEIAVIKAEMKIRDDQENRIRNLERAFAVMAFLGTIALMVFGAYLHKL